MRTVVGGDTSPDCGNHGCRHGEPGHQVRTGEEAVFGDVPAMVHFSPVRYGMSLDDKCLSSTPYRRRVSFWYRLTPYSMRSGAYREK